MFDNYLKILRVIGELFGNLSDVDAATIFNGWIPNYIDLGLDGFRPSRCMVQIVGSEEPSNLNAELSDPEFCSKVKRFIKTRTGKCAFDAEKELSIKTDPIDDGVLIVTVDEQYMIKFEIF